MEDLKAQIVGIERGAGGGGGGFVIDLGAF